MSGHGAFIVISGSDSSGKQTQTERLVNTLRSEQGYTSITPAEEQRVLEMLPDSYPDTELEPRVDDSIEDGVWHLSFPTYQQTVGGRIVDAYLQGGLGARTDISLQNKINFYAADRKPFKEPIRQYVKAGGIIICDRYREANLIHQLVGFEEDEWGKKMTEIKAADEDMPDPDATIYLHIPPEESLRRLESKEKDIHEADTAYMRASNANGLRVAEHEGWEIIRADGAREEVEQEIWGRVQSYLPKTD